MSTVRVLISSLVLAWAALLLLGCGGSQKTESTPQPPTAGAPTGSVATATASTSAPIAQTQLGDLLLKVNGANLYADKALLPAAPGTHYVAVDVTLKNSGSQDFKLNVLDFRLSDGDGNVHDPVITGGPEPQISSYYSLAPGQEVRGFIVFPLVDGTDPVELQYRSPTGTTGTLPVPKPAP